MFRILFLFFYQIEVCAHQCLHYVSDCIDAYFISLIATLFVLKMPRLSRDLRNQAIGMIAAGSKIKDVAARLNVHRNTISSLLIRHRRTGTFYNGFISAIRQHEHAYLNPSSIFIDKIKNCIAYPSLTVRV